MLDGLLYQFKETLKSHGKDIKINNADARVILKSTKNEHDDKEILTTDNIAKGDYIHYNNLNFLALTETVDKYGSVYSKSTIRKCNFDLKFIINDKLYLFYSIIAGDKFFIQNYNIISISGDTVSVTLPNTPTTRQIKREDNFIKWGQSWSIEGMDYTKDGLIILNCKATEINTATDDSINEIADRWVEIDGEKIDRLNGNITPILPFDEEPEEPIDPEEPEPTEPTQGITYTVTSIDEYDKTDVTQIWANDWAEFTIHKFVDGIEVSGVFTFEIDSTNLATIVVSGNTATITAKDVRVGGNLKLTVIDTETDEIAIEQIIKIVGY